jgi:hypothetical protein
MQTPTHKLSVIAIVLSVFLMATIPASAQQSSISFTNSTTASGLNSFFNIALGKFNSNLGSLDAVTVTVQSAVIGGSFIIGAPNPALDQEYEGAAARVTIRQATTNALGFTQLGETSYNVTTTPAPIVLIPGGTTNSFSVDSFLALTNIVQSIDSAFWSAYSLPGGSGDVVFQVRNRPDITISGGDFFLNATDFTVETTMSVTYAYTVPEPSTYALFALTALGLAAYGWRRRA